MIDASIQEWTLLMSMVLKIIKMQKIYFLNFDVELSKTKPTAEFHNVISSYGIVNVLKKH